MHFCAIAELPARTDAHKDYEEEEEEPENKKSSHKAAEQRRRDSLKLCFEELRRLLPFIPPEDDEEAPKRPGEGNVGGQRSGVIDLDNPNKGVSKVALLRKSNEYILKLCERVNRRDKVIQSLKGQLVALGLQPLLPEDGDAYAFEDLDASERGSWPHPDYVRSALYGNDVDAEGDDDDEMNGSTFLEHTTKKGSSPKRKTSSVNLQEGGTRTTRRSSRKGDLAV